MLITLASFIDFPRALLPASPIRLSATSLYDVSFFSQTISFTLRLNTLNPDKFFRFYSHNLVYLPLELLFLESEFGSSTKLSTKKMSLS